MRDANQQSTWKIQRTIGRDRPTGEPKRHLRRRILITSAMVLAFCAILVVAAVWLSIKANFIGGQLESAVGLIPKLKAEVARNDAAAAATTVNTLTLHTARAREATNDPVWTMAGTLPWVGPNFQAASEVATSAEEVTERGIRPLVGVFQTLDWKTLAPNGGAVDLVHLAKARPQLVAAAHAVRQSSDRLNGIDADSLLPQLSAPLVKTRAQLASLSEDLDAAADVVTIAPTMMGAETPRNYLLLVQNNAESRSTGGIPGALAVLNIDKGKISLGSQTSATAIGAFKPLVNVDPEQTRIYSARLGKFMQDVNLTPDFPTAAHTAQAMWTTKTGDPIDGVLSIDPIALSYILDATGPVRISDPLVQEAARAELPLELTAKNVVPTLLSDVYSKIADPDVQDVYFAGVAQEVFSKLSAGNGNTKKLLDGLSRGASERRILLWSSKADEESIVSRYALGGSMTGVSISPAEFGVYFNDGTGAKMDYHVKRTVQLIRECPADGYSHVKVRVTSTNTAPKDAATSLPEYVTGGGAFGVPAGSVQTNIIAYGPVQSNVNTVLVAGKKTGFASHRHSGRPVGAVTVQLAPGQSSVVEFTFDKIVQHTEPNVSVTPTVQALKDVVLDTIPAKCVPVP